VILLVENFLDDILNVLPVTWLPGPKEETAIAIIPGQNEPGRVIQGLEFWPEGKYCLVPGTRDDPLYLKETIISFTGRESSNLFCQGFSVANLNTFDQMEWLIGFLINHPEIKYLIFTTAVYHLPRAVLTFLASMEKAGHFVKICPRPIWSPFCSFFEVFNSKRLEDEIKRIEVYRGKGHVASLAMWENYKKLVQNIKEK